MPRTPPRSTGKLAAQPEQIRPTVKLGVPPEQLLSPEDLASWVDVPISTIYQWRTRGLGPKAIRVGRHTRYRRSDVEAWLTAQEAEG